MNKRGLKWLYQELPELVKNGILNQESSDKLIQYYGEIKNTAKTWLMLIIFGILGAILIGLGIILLIGHNWEQLSRLTRCALSILPLIAAQIFAGWVLWKRPDSAALKEGSAIFLSLMAGASIALISQTYNIPGDAETFLLTWMFLILPVVYLMQASIPAAIYLAGITCWSGANWDNPSSAVLFWPLAALVIPHFIWSLGKKIYTLRSAIISLVIAVCIPYGAGFSLGKTWPGSWIVIFSSIASVFYALGHMKFENITTNWQRPLRLIGSIGIIILAFTFTFRNLWEFIGRYGYFSKDTFYSAGASMDHIITFSIVVLSVLLFYDNVKRRDYKSSLFGALPLLAIACYFLRAQSTNIPLVVFNIYLLTLSINRIASGARTNNLGSLNAGMLILAALIIARFFDSDLNFVVKGLVFIAIGVGFLASNLVLIRKKGGAQ